MMCEEVSLNDTDNTVCMYTCFFVCLFVFVCICPSSCAPECPQSCANARYVCKQVSVFTTYVSILSITCLFPARIHIVCLLVGCLTSQQHANVSQGRICTDNFTCCHTEIEVADETFYLTQSQYTDTGLTSPSTDPIMPGTWQGSHWSANF